MKGTLSRLVIYGPIGKLMQWIDRRIEAREDRNPEARVDGTVRTIALTERTELRDSGIDDRPDQRSAA